MTTTKEITDARLAELYDLWYTDGPGSVGGVFHGGNGDIYFRALLRYGKYPVRETASRYPWTTYCVLWRWSGKKDGVQAYEGSQEWQVYMQDQHPDYKDIRANTSPLTFQRLEDVIKFVEEANKREDVEYIPATIEYRVRLMEHSSFGHGVNFFFPSRKTFEELVPNFEEALKIRQYWGTPVGVMTVLGRTDDVYVMELQ